MLGEEAPGGPARRLVLAQERPERLVDLCLTQAPSWRPADQEDAELVGPALHSPTPARLLVELLMGRAYEVAVGGPFIGAGEEVLKVSRDFLFASPSHEKPDDRPLSAERASLHSRTGVARRGKSSVGPGRRPLPHLGCEAAFPWVGPL